MDFRKNKVDHLLIMINADCVEIEQSFTFLGKHMSDNLTWSTNITAAVKKPQPRLHSLRILKKLNLCQELLSSFYHSVIKGHFNTLPHCMVCRVFSGRLGEFTEGHKNCPQNDSPSLDDMANICYHRRANNIIKDISHPGHRFFELQPSGKWYRSLRTLTSRLQQPFSP